MNAPPGVDTDTSGEDFTPPPTPPPDRTRPQFSLTSLLTATPRPRKAQREAAELVKHQTPIEAADDAPKQRISKLKKKVRIAVGQQTDEADQPIEPEQEETEENPITIPQLQDAIEQNPKSESSGAVIGLLNQLLAQNDDIDAEDADSELSNNLSDDPQSAADAAQPGPAIVPSLEVPAAGPGDQPPPLLKPRRQLRKRTRLKLLPTWLRSKKNENGLPVSSQEDQPTSMASPPASVPLSGLVQSKINPAVDQPTPWSAPLLPPASSPYNSQSVFPESAHAPGTHGSQGPSAAQYWSSYHQHNTLPYYNDSQRPDPTAAWEGMPNPPPWLWTGHHDHLAREAAIVPPSQHPPYPPLYPHPGSLQPWNPWYPPQQSTRAPTGPDPRSNPYEGTREPGPSPPGVSGITVPPISQYPGTSVDGQKVPLGHRSEKGCGVPSVSINETNPQTSPGPATKPELVDAESLMSSVIPVVGSSYPLNLAGDLTKHPTCTSGSEESASDRKQLSGSPTHRKTKNKDDPHHRQHMECRQGRGNPTDAYQQDAVASRGAAKVGQSRQEHDLSPTTDIPLASQSQDNQSERKRQELNAPRSPSLVRGSTRNSGPVERQSAGVVPLLGPHPRWSECLISLAVCINLVNTVIEKTRKRSDRTHESHKDVSIRLLTSVVSSLIVQRSLTGALRDTLGEQHPTAIDSFVKEVQTLAKFLRHRATKAGLCDKDIDQLSRLHKHASDSLHSAGTTLLLSHLAELTFLATPKIISAVLEMGSDWYRGELSGKKVAHTAMLIRHELKASRQDTREEKDGDKDTKIGWSASALTHGIDLLCKFVDPEVDQGGKQTTADDAKSNNKSLEKARSLNNQDYDPEDHAKPQDIKKEQETSQHRSPMSVLSDLVHSRSCTDQTHTKATRSSLKEKPEHDTIHRTKAHLAQSSEDSQGSRANKEGVSARSGTRERDRHKIVTRPSFPIAPATSSLEARYVLQNLKPGKELLLEEPTSGMWSYPDSSPSVYSQDDMDSEGTVESDREARELLAHADSAPARKRTETTGVQDNKERQPTKEQVNRAKKVVLGEKVSKK